MAVDGDDVDSRGPAVLAVTVTTIAISTFFTLLRMVSRIAIVRKVSWDDYFLVLAWTIAFGLSFSICYGTSRGLGRHDVDILPVWHAPLKKSEYAFSVLYNPALMATKTSILIFYLNLSRTQPIFRWASIITMVVVNAAGLALTILNIFQCRPVDAVIQNPSPPSAKCIDIVTLYLSSAPVNILTDLAILFIPIPLLTRMRLPRKQKNILVFTFALGGFVAVVDVVRIAYLQQASLSRLENLGVPVGSRIAGQRDFSWYASLSYMWSAVEVNVGIICACIPTLKPLITRILPSLLSDTSKTSAQGGSRSERPRTLEMNGSAARGSPPFPEAGFKESPSRSGSGEKDQDGDMGMMDFLTTPDMNQLPSAARSEGTREEANTFFDFVNMNRPRSMVKMTSKESYFPLALVTILFFLWGFAYGLLDVLNAQFQLVVEMSIAQSTGLHSAYWAGYFVAPLTFGRYILKKWGFKATFIAGLCIYGTGTLIFWPSAVLTSVPAFLISNFIVGLGLATLEVAANPFIVLCGPEQYAETRSNLAQGIQAVGSVVSPLLAQRVLFREFQDAPSLIDVQWTYLAIALFDVALALVFFYLPLPEASDDDLEDIADRRRGAYSSKFGGVSIVFVTLGIAVFSQFCYVGGQEAVGIAYQNISAIWPTIFAIALRGLGRHTKTASAFLTAAASGGAVFPAVMKAVADGHGVQYAMCVVVAVYSFGALFPIYLNVLPAAKRQVDPVIDLSRPSTPGSSASRTLSSIFRRKKQSSDLPTAEHIEQD
ncbi:MAG: hypothetical protein M1833_002840 [Piccolia ochrophora]|nr:MAG: hypothetical protein M1833_002840 [Piccolia ochrophora]